MYASVRRQYIMEKTNKNKLRVLSLFVEKQTNKQADKTDKKNKRISQNLPKKL